MDHDKLRQFLTAEDDQAPARGCLIGMAMGLGLWAIFAGVLIWMLK